MAGIVGRFKADNKMKLLDMLVNLGGYYLYSDLGQKFQVGKLEVAFEGVFVKCWFLEERYDKGLFIPVGEDTFMERKVDNIGYQG